MTTNPESGHALNVSNFESLISSITVYASSYNPSKDSLQLPAMQTLLNTAHESLTNVNNQLAAYSLAVDAQQIAFTKLGKLIPRVRNALKASDSSILNDESVETIFRKLLGKRAGTKLSTEEKQALATEGKEVKQVSVSQMSHVNMANNFNKLIAILSGIPEYRPNEEDLKIESLKAFANELNDKNMECQEATNALKFARDSRDEIMYKPLTGLVDIAIDCKTYIKSIAGKSGSLYKKIVKLIFKNLKKKHK